MYRRAALVGVLVPLYPIQIVYPDIDGEPIVNDDPICQGDADTSLLSLTSTALHHRSTGRKMTSKRPFTL